VSPEKAVRHLLADFLTEEGYSVVTATDGSSALAMVTSGVVCPDIILADYNLDGKWNGLDTSMKLRDAMQRKIPGIILSGRSTEKLKREIVLQNFWHLPKPMRLADLGAMVTTLIAAPPKAVAPHDEDVMIYVVDDDPGVCASMAIALEAEGRLIRTFHSAEAFLAAYEPARPGCLLIDEKLPGMSGQALLRHLAGVTPRLAAIMITGQGDVKMAVAAMQAGALDFLEKPASYAALCSSIERALEHNQSAAKHRTGQNQAAERLAGLTQRQMQIMGLVLAGRPSKRIATDLGISQRTVENHRASIMEKTGAKSLPGLARLALAAGLRF